MKAEQKARCAKLLKKSLVYFAVGLGYLLFVLLTDWRIPCVFYELSGKYCPGCGITRMCVALARLDIKGAAGHNLLAFCLLPFALWLGVSRAIEYIKTGTLRERRWEKIVWVAMFMLFVAFAVMRNMPEFAFLAP